MSSPAKRRKKGDHPTLTQAGRGIEFFFSKQRGEANQAQVEPVSSQGEEEKPTSSESRTSAKNDTAVFLDEELARRLQEEWNNEVTEPGDHLQTDDAAVAPEISYASPPAQPSENAQKLGMTRDITSSNENSKTLTLQSTTMDEDSVAATLPFDDNPLTFTPSKYISDLQNHWASDQGHVSYALLTRCFVLVNATSSRIKIVDTLVNMLRTIIESDSDSLLPAVCLF
jgi:DNA ligase 1